MIVFISAGFSLSLDLKLEIASSAGETSVLLKLSTGTLWGKYKSQDGKYFTKLKGDLGPGAV